jgi:c(7)-type cytochrome triheme protein
MKLRTLISLFALAAALQAPAQAQQKAKEATAAAPAAATPAAPAAAPAGDVNSFNRLLKPAGKRNPPPPEDGIHDPGNDGTHALLPPLTAYAGLPKSFAGNRINWVEAIGTKKINPRWDRNDPKAEPVVMDLNIVREVKGSMPDVVYPHKQHTEWLDCSNCHPAIFVPQKGANSISMAAILLGEKCGVCHGKVAFPVSECRLCHSKKKDFRPNQAAAPAAAPAK